MDKSIHIKKISENVYRYIRGNYIALSIKLSNDSYVLTFDGKRNIFERYRKEKNKRIEDYLMQFRLPYIYMMIGHKGIGKSNMH